MHKTIICLLAIVACVAHAAEQYSPEQIRGVIKQAGGPEQFLKVIAANTAKMSGQMFDDQTQITGSVAHDRAIIYYMRLVNYEKEDISDLPQFRREIATMLDPSVCTAPVASVLINEYGADYKYRAYSKSRTFLFEYSFNKKTCSPGYHWKP